MINTGQFVDHFKILEKLGSGGMGDVFLAEDTKLGRKVALKFLAADYFTDSERLGRFQREAKTAAQISHPNVTAIYDLGAFKAPGSNEKSLYIVMEHVSGESLKSRLSGAKTDLSEILRLAEKIGAGLSAAHKLGIVHRDIKADNILINEDGEPKILDFGLAKFAEGAILQDSDRPDANPDDDDGDTISRELTQAGKIVGTVTYMSPEQARGEEIDTRSDIFSFGVLLYRMAAGEFPFSGPTQVSTLAKILEATQDPPSAKNSAIPPELERIITKCLQKNAADRYQDTRDMVLDLRSLRKQFDSGITDSISSISSPAIALPRTSSIKGKALGLGAVAVIALALTYAFFPFGGSDSGSGQQLAAAENSIAILDFANKTSDPELQWLESGLPEILLTDLTENQALNVIARSRILDHIRAKKNSSATNATPEEMREACALIGAGSIISGSYYKIGDKIRIDARLEETSTGNVIWSQKVVGEDLFTLVDSLTEKISLSLNVADLAPSDQQIADVMTSSPEAYRLYLEGVELMLSERSKEAQVIFQKALEIDSSFAMAYLRLGMSHMFSGHNQQGQTFLRKAITLENKLPVRSRSLLDIYVDIFLTRNYTDGFAKMESYVKNYPTDKEARTFYGSILTLTQQDTAVAFAQFDTALAQDPTYQFALSTYGTTLLKYNNYERALDVMGQLLKFHPESPAAYTNLIAIYTSQGNLDKAIEMAERLRSTFPERRSPLATMVSLQLRLRQFDSAAHYSELYRQFDTTDHFAMMSYYRTQARLATWKGQFRAAVTAMHGLKNEAILSGDNDRISSSYRSLAGKMFVIGQIDSAVIYSRRAFDLKPQVFSAISYPLTVISFDHEEGMKLKGVFDSLATVFQAQVPQGMWSLVDALRDIYDGAYERDTLQMIAALNSICSNPKFISGGNLRELAELQAHFGQYTEALKSIKLATSDKFASTNGYSVLKLLYIAGLAHEGLGHNNEAVKAYQEMLQYWGNPDIEIKIISDAKERLAKLTT
jgi:eukaryotic-like serine/threonine-protein kinase